MNIKQRLKAVLQEAEIYRSQGLIAEAQGKYKEAAHLVDSIAKLKNKESLLGAITEKIKALDSTKEQVEKGPDTPELSQKAQDLIKKLFTFSESTDQESASLEGAVALAKFGQFDRALSELNGLLARDKVRVEAAKNIIQCHLASASPEEAISQYHQWYAGDLFSANQLETVRTFLEEILQKRGVEAALPSLVAAKDAEATDDEPAMGIEAPVETDEEFLDITSIGITFDAGPRKGKMVEFDVNFQSGNMLSLIISKQENELIDTLQQGLELKEVQFFSPIAIFNGAGIVASKTKIKTGPKQGDYCVDIRIVST